MKTISLKLPVELNARLDRASQQRQQSKSDLVRAALEQFLERTHPPAAGSALEAAQRWIGCVEGLRDLATNPKHLEDFGK